MTTICMFSSSKCVFISLPNPTKNTILSIIKIRKFCCFFDLLPS